jgi:NADH:ubiquinone oxidoreductase subunit F (NADH-binding)
VSGSPLVGEAVSRATGAAVARLGEHNGLLLAGPPASAGLESFAHHVRRLGPSPPASAQDVRAAIRASGLQGRGGGAFPLWRKVQTALDAPGEPLLVINCSESEPASRKDWILCSFRPHTLLEGAAAIARASESTRVVIHLHGDSIEPTAALRRALHERGAVAGDPEWQLSSGPGGYVSGEASAVARFLHQGVALPVFNAVPLAHRGPTGRPTIVTNAETAAQVAVLLRVGAPAWRAAGSDDSPGSRLLTLVGSVPAPHTVVELVGPSTIGELLQDAGVPAAPLAVLIGGYEGVWIPGDVAWQTPIEPAALSCVGAAIGCGLIGVLPHGACGLTETARITRYLAGESAGQCGPCRHGLPLLGELFERLAKGAAGRRALRRMRHTASALPGSGACAHPDGVARLVLSALGVFDDDVVRHRAGKPCHGADHPPVFPMGRAL